MKFELATGHTGQKLVICKLYVFSTHSRISIYRANYLFVVDYVYADHEYIFYVQQTINMVFTFLLSTIWECVGVYG